MMGIPLGPGGGLNFAFFVGVTRKKENTTKERMARNAIIMINMPCGLANWT